MIKQLRTYANVAGIEALMQPNLQTKTVPAVLQSLALNEINFESKDSPEDLEQLQFPDSSIADRKRAGHLESGATYHGLFCQHHPFFSRVVCHPFQHKK